jgi:hypothetical protein
LRAKAKVEAAEASRRVMEAAKGAAKMRRRMMRDVNCVRNSRFLHQNRNLEIKGLLWCINYVHNKPVIYGYARVSTDGQSVDAQVRQLTKAGCTKVFRETASGAKTDRAELRKALAKLDDDDVLMVTRLDRLARSTRDLLNTLATITERSPHVDGAGWACRV